MRQNSKNNELRGVYDNVMLPNYSPANFVPKKAEGSLVWDQDDKEYIDFGGGIAVNSLGHSHPSLIKALTDQSKKIWHLSNYLTNEPAIKLANKLTELTFAENIFFAVRDLNKYKWKYELKKNSFLISIQYAIICAIRSFL